MLHHIRYAPSKREQIGPLSRHEGDQDAAVRDNCCHEDLSACTRLSKTQALLVVQIEKDGMAVRQWKTTESNMRGL